MNYNKIYKNLVNCAQKKRRSKKDGIAYEAHHIAPRSLFPELLNNKENIVLLTPKEHYIAHHLLTKIYPNTGMHSAFFLMCNKTTNSTFKREYRVTASVYAKAKEEFQKNNPAQTLEAKAKISKTKKGKNHHYYGKKGDKHPCFKPERFDLIHKDGRTFTGTRTDMHKFLGLSRPNISALTTKRQKHTGGWYLKGTEPSTPLRGKHSPYADHTNYQWYNKKTAEYFTGSKWNFMDKTKIPLSSVYHLIYETRKSCRGWTIIKTQEK